MGNIHSVLFVCTGNSCRSVMAQGLLKKYLAKLGKGHIRVFSAGIIASFGMPPTKETLEIMKEGGIDASDFKSSPLTDDMIRKADLILAMESIHKSEVVKKVREAASKTYLLKEFGVPSESGRRPEDLDIKDPMAQPFSEYKKCFDAIKKEIERITGLL